MSLRGWLRAGGMAVCLSLAMPSAPAGAQPSVDPPRQIAGGRFKEAEAAFVAGDFVRAGTLFEEANALSPHPSALWNAARAWQRAGDVARAMNLYSRYLADAPADAPDRDAAAAAAAELRPRVARIEIRGRGELTSVSVDDDQVAGDTVWVVPGTHLVTARRGSATVSALVTATAGGEHAVTLEARGPAGSAPGGTGEAAAPPPGPDTSVDPPRDGWPPVVFIISASVTAVSASWLVWSAIDTQNKSDDYDSEYGKPTASGDDVEAAKKALDEGKKAQQRTNFLIGSTAAAGAFTVVSAFLTDWRSAAERRRQQKQQAPKAGVSLGPGSFVVHGAF